MRTTAPAFASHLVVLAVSVTMGSTALAQGPTAHTVLTIHSGAVDYSPNPVVDAGIREALYMRPQLVPPVDYFTEYLEFERLPDAATSAALAEYIRRKYQGRRIDVVVAITHRVLRFVLDRHHELFPHAQVVVGASGFDPDAAQSRGGIPVTGVRVGNAYAETVKLALRLHPGTRRVYVVAITPDEDSVAVVRGMLRPLASQVTLTYLGAESESALQAAVRAVPRDSIILYIWYQQTGRDYVMDPLSPARLVASAARVPVYGTVDANLGTGIVGGMLRDTRKTGVRVGEMVGQILDGRSASSIPVEDAPLGPVFDWRQLQRAGISESALPANATILFRQPSVWESYRWYIIAASVVIAGQLLLITGLLTERGQRRRAEAALQTRESTLRRSYARIRQLAGRLIRAQETARAEIARDLHDDVCQELVGISMSVSNLKRLGGSLRDPGSQQALSQLEKSTLAAVESIRRMSHELHPASLRLLGLASARKGHCFEVEMRHNVMVAFAAEGDVKSLPPDVAVGLFRIAQEALRNATAHGAATRMSVTLQRTPAFVELSVTDDGKGFDVEAVRAGGGLGLVSIEERAHVVGGTVDIASQVRRGTTIRVRVPIEAQAGASGPEAADPIPAEEQSAIQRLAQAYDGVVSEVMNARRLRAWSRRGGGVRNSESAPMPAPPNGNRQDPPA